jgi:D-glycero-D-manno-heptose 1,7-bisphosphate phosphatase
MILQAAVEFGIDLPQSTLVGDRETDIQAGRAAGVGCNLLYQPRTDSSPPDPASVATSTIRTLLDAVPFLNLQIADKGSCESCMS